jgi:hypothetical protein
MIASDEAINWPCTVHMVQIVTSAPQRNGRKPLTWRHGGGRALCAGGVPALAISSCSRLIDDAALGSDAKAKAHIARARAYLKAMALDPDMATTCEFG